jgi:NADH dehydrogenase
MTRGGCFWRSFFYLIGFQNRLLVLIRWSFSFATHGRGARLITAASAPSEQRDG